MKRIDVYLKNGRTIHLKGDVLEFKPNADLNRSIIKIDDTSILMPDEICAIIVDGNIS